MRGFLTRLMQRSRGEADTTMPYRAPLWTYGLTPQNDAAMRATAETVTTADTSWIANHDESDRKNAGQNDGLDYSNPPAKLKPVTIIESHNARTAEAQTAYRRSLRQPVEAADVMASFPSTQPLTGKEPYRSMPNRLSIFNAIEQVTPTASAAQNSLQPAVPHHVLNNTTPLSPMANMRHQANLQTPSQAAARSQALPLDKPAMRLSQENQTVDVHIHIGRIDICATSKNTPSKQETKAKSLPAMTLSNYIQQRTGAKR